MNKPITIYLADDHQMTIDGLALLISSEVSMKVVGYANDGDTAYKHILAWKPDVAIVDFRMPGMTGLDLILKLSGTLKNTKFIILSMHDDRRYIKDAIRGGAAGYLLKNVGKDELIKCLTAVLNDEKYFPNLPPVKQQDDRIKLTPRERDIIKLIISHHTTNQIAEKLCLSKHTIDVHRKNICSKTKTKTAIELKDFIHEHHIEL